MITISPYFLIALFLAHLVGDFWFQTRWMGKGKSKRWLPLLSHIAVYTTTLGLFTYPMSHTYGWWVWFVVFNGFAHLITDTYSSQLSSYFWENKKEGAFWITVGCDQFIHAMCLVSSVGALLK